MPRRSYRFREYILKPDQAADAEPTRFVMQCVACEFFGPKGEDAEDGTEWATEHLKQRPDHLVYREHITRTYRFEAGEWQ
ncbi:hypothetical protein [Streptomyces profundus]|uniref:DUF7848 domain-containing protein n=1 Tax=Streptomyces profundus TaxID=2867410 RepID=UPI001D16C6E5|nr:hypothetical protein [Streptomyces sp. MA3_2.13]UED86324.1 hypothetical protein K4G22_20755 [Streptomyces sp. MA3_2.13]